MSIDNDSDHHARWQRIATHPLGGDDIRFAARVAQANGWTLDEAHAAIVEYRRFAFLACLGEEVTPSKAVDAVWHEHLVHTRDYWLEFCPRALGMPLHHAPGGAPEDEARFATQYERTLRAYEQWFGAPPPRWWPQRRAVPKPRSAAPVAFALAALPAFALAAVQPANPLDWTGPEFLTLYLALLIGLTVFAFVLRGVLRRAGAARANAGKLGVLDTAYLAGGAARCVDAAVAELHERGALHWNAGTHLFEKRPPRQALDAQLQSAADALASSLDTGTTWTGRIRADLERRGLWHRGEDLRRTGLWATMPLWLLLGFGLAKIAVGVQRERPVTALAMLCAITFVLALFLIFQRPGATGAGRAALERRRAEHRASGRTNGTGIGLAVALGGTALLADTALAGYHDLRRPTGSSSSDSGSSSSSDSSSDSGDSGGGSSCGGCGGGGGD